MQEAVTTLYHAVRLKVVAKYLGQLALMLALLTLVPLLVSLFYGEHFYSLRYAGVILALLVLGIPGLKLAEPSDIHTNEALVITALAFVLSPLLISWPMMAAGLPFIDAWFEAVSGITTTGLTTVQAFSDKPMTFLFARAWIQWYGGLGIVILSVALLMGHHNAMKRLLGPEGGQSMITTTRHYARRVLVVYVLLSLVGVIVVWLLLQDGFLAITHVMTAISTAGYSPLDNSLAGIDNWGARAAIMVLCFCGAVPFVLYYRLFKGNWRGVVFDSEFQLLLLLTLVVSAALSLILAQQFEFSYREALGHGFLLGTSAQTSTGFSSLNVGELDPLAKGILIIAMFIGGDMGSTAGGIKILRLLILARLIQLIIQRYTLPAHAVIQPRLDNRNLEHDEIHQALVLILLFVMVNVLSWLIFLAYGYPPLDALFEVVSATGTVGLSTGITHPDLEPSLKMVLILDMLLGRLEIIALLIVLYYRTWIGKRMA